MSGVLVAKTVAGKLKNGGNPLKLIYRLDVRIVLLMADLVEKLVEPQKLQ